MKSLTLKENPRGPEQEGNVTLVDDEGEVYTLQTLDLDSAGSTIIPLSESYTVVVLYGDDGDAYGDSEFNMSTQPEELREQTHGVQFFQLRDSRIKGGLTMLILPPKNEGIKYSDTLKQGSIYPGDNAKIPYSDGTTVKIVSKKPYQVFFDDSAGVKVLFETGLFLIKAIPTNRKNDSEMVVFESVLLKVENEDD